MRQRTKTVYVLATKNKNSIMVSPNARCKMGVSNTFLNRPRHWFLMLKPCVPHLNIQLITFEPKDLKTHARYEKVVKMALIV